MIFESARSNADFLSNETIFKNTVERSFKQRFTKTFCTFNNISPIYFHFSCGRCSSVFKRYNNFFYSAEKCRSCKVSCSFIVDSIYFSNIVIPEGTWGVLCAKCDTFMQDNWPGTSCLFCRGMNFYYSKFPSAH